MRKLRNSQAVGTDTFVPRSASPNWTSPSIGLSNRGIGLCDRSRTLGRMSVPRDERLSAARVVSHLVVMVAVAAVIGVVVAGLAIPFAGVLGVGARNVAETMDNLPAELETDPLPQQTQMLDADGNTIATLLRREPRQRLARPDLARSWSRRSSRSRTTASTSTARSTSRARCARSSPTRPTTASSRVARRSPSRWSS